MSKTNKTGGGNRTGTPPKNTATAAEHKSAAEAAKETAVKPETEKAVKEAAAAVTGTAKHASGVAKDQAENAKATAREAIDTAKDEARTQGDNIKAQAKARADEAKAKASEMTDEAKRRAREHADERKRQATGALGTTASDLRKASGAVEETWMSRAFDTVADQIEGVTRSVDNKSPEELTQVARRAARDNPGIFLAGCFAAGVAISRTLKVAASRAPDHLYDEDDQPRGRLSGQSQPARAQGDLPDVGGKSAPDGQVGIGSGTGPTEGLSGSSNR